MYRGENEFAVNESIDGGIGGWEELFFVEE